MSCGDCKGLPKFLRGGREGGLLKNFGRQKLRRPLLYPHSLVDGHDTMPPQIPFRPRGLHLVSSNSHNPCCQVRLASVVAAQHSSVNTSPLIPRAPSTQPPSHKAPTLRKSQLHRQYQSLLQSNPLILILQHNNLKAAEWASIRRELHGALAKIDQSTGSQVSVATATKISIVHSGILESALKVIEFWKPRQHAKSKDGALSNPAHGLSQQAWRSANRSAKKQRHGLEPLLSGPLALITFPVTSPEHLAATLSIFSPNEKFPAPKRKANPDFYSPQVQSGLQKIMLLGARVEGRAMDDASVKWVGGIQGGLTGLRAQLVGMLSSAGVNLASVLDGASRSLWLTMESRRLDLEDSGKSAPGQEAQESAKQE